MKNLDYVLMARQEINLKRIDRVADNVANSNTNGFKSERDVFKSFVLPVAQGDSVAFGQFGMTLRNPIAGPMEATERPFDVAIQGGGYFKVQTPQGERYTRAGNFAVDSEGRMVTQEGYVVMGAGGGGVNFLPEDTNISIREDGTVFSGQDERGRIGVFTFANEQALTRTGQNLYLAQGGEQPAGPEVSVLQGMLEHSNVNSVREMTTLIDASREYQNINAMIKRQSELKSELSKRLLANG